jgi:hypothetical protein
MALPASGPISMSMLMTELENTGRTSNIELSKIGSLLGSDTNTGSGYVPVNRSAPTKPTDDVVPSAVSEWYSYNHTANQNCPTGDVDTPILLGNYLYYRVNVTGSSGAVSSITISSPDNVVPFLSTMRFQIYTAYPFTNTGTLTGFPVFDGTFTNTNFQTYDYTLSSTSQVLYLVMWKDGSQDQNILTPIYFLSTPSCSNTDNIRAVITSNNDSTLAAASSNSSALLNPRTGALITGFNYVRDEGGSIYNINSSTAVVGSLHSNC